MISLFLCMFYIQKHVTWFVVLQNMKECSQIYTCLQKCHKYKHVHKYVHKYAHKYEHVHMYVHKYKHVHKNFTIYTCSQECSQIPTFSQITIVSREIMNYKNPIARNYSLVIHN